MGDAMNDSWAEVELYRWQHGGLPPQNPDLCKEVDPKAAVEAMCRAIERGCAAKTTEGMPSPFSVVTVLRYLADRLPAKQPSRRTRPVKSWRK